MNFYTSNIKARYYQHGEIIPELHWNGDKGLVSLVNTDPNFSVDPTTGKLSWNRLKEPDKVYDLTIKASNSAGEVMAHLEITNFFSAKFKVKRTKGLNSDEYLDYEQDLIVWMESGGIAGWEYSWAGASWEFLENGNIRLSGVDYTEGGVSVNVVYVMEMIFDDAREELKLQGFWDEEGMDEVPDKAKGKVRMEFLSSAS